jgi:hypothetical protein
MEKRKGNGPAGALLPAVLLFVLLLAAGALLATGDREAAFAEEEDGVLRYTQGGNDVTITDCAPEATWEDVEAA